MKIVKVRGKRFINVWMAKEMINVKKIEYVWPKREVILNVQYEIPNNRYDKQRTLKLEKARFQNAKELVPMLFLFCVAL